MVGASKSWVYHHWSQSKDYLGELPKLDTKKHWNHSNQLFPKGQDVWGYLQEKDEAGNRLPVERVPIIHVDPL